VSPAYRSITCMLTGIYGRPKYLFNKHDDEVDDFGKIRVGPYRIARPIVDAIICHGTS
jgi:hypothetical protein